MTRSNNIRHIATCIALLVATLLLTGCHSKRAVQRTDNRHGGVANTRLDNDWSRLDIELGKRDNAALYRCAKEWLGVPYKYGGQSKRGADCSGFVCQVFSKVYGVQLQRNSRKIYFFDCDEIQSSKLREADLVFFATGKSQQINHVGIYLKQNKFVHATSSRGVIVSDMSERYWSNALVACGRVRQLK